MVLQSDMVTWQLKSHIAHLAQTDMKVMGVRKKTGPSKEFISIFLIIQAQTISHSPPGGFGVFRAPSAGWIIININCCLFTLNFSTQTCSVCWLWGLCQQVCMYICVQVNWGVDDFIICAAVRASETKFSMGTCHLSSILSVSWWLFSPYQYILSVERNLWFKQLYFSSTPDIQCNAALQYSLGACLCLHSNLC